MKQSMHPPTATRAWAAKWTESRVGELLLLFLCVSCIHGCKSLSSSQASSKAAPKNATEYAEKNYTKFAEQHAEEARVAETRRAIPKGPDSLFAEYR